MRALVLLLVAATACGGEPGSTITTVTLPGSVLGAEGVVLRRQLGRFMAEHPGIRVDLQPTPDAADQRHQLYVQWLNAETSEPDILQLDVIWTAEFAAAGWVMPLERFAPDTAAFLPATIAANRWNDSLFALPWFVDVGMLYWRTDLVARAPATFEELTRAAQHAIQAGGVRYGLVWQGARYEGLVTTFLEYLAGHGGRIIEGRRVAVNSPAGLAALTEMLQEIYGAGIVPRAVLTWHEEESRFAFQNGEAVFLRNWPYACALLQDSSASQVAGKFAVAPMPAAPGGIQSAALGGAQLAINRRSRHPEAAWEVIEYLTRPAQMIERGRAVGQFPTRVALYDQPDSVLGLPIPVAEARRVVLGAVPRPVTPVYTELSTLLQVHLHRALTRQEQPAEALARAAEEMQQLLNRVGLGLGDSAGRP
jgi:multiple sugar transport system substrate-binding protein